MDINSLLKSFDNLIKDVDNNKILLLIIIIIVGIYTFNYVKYDSIDKVLINMFSNYYFKFGLFVIITYISSSSPALGLSLAIAMLVTLQIITNIKIKNELLGEKFTVSPLDNANNYLSNPLLKENELSPPVNLNLKIEGKNQLWYNIINKGKTLLDDSLELEKDLTKRYDTREKHIAEITKRNGLELLESGINRLEKSNNGELNINANSSNIGNLLIYNQLMENNLNNNEVKSSYSDLKNKFSLLTSNENSNKLDFDKKLEEFYQSELNFLKNVYETKKHNLDNNTKKKIESLLIKLIELKQQNKPWRDNLVLISNIIS